KRSLGPAAGEPGPAPSPRNEPSGKDVSIPSSPSRASAERPHSPPFTWLKATARIASTPSAIIDLFICYLPIRTCIIANVSTAPAVHAPVHPIFSLNLVCSVNILWHRPGPRKEG